MRPEELSQWTLPITPSVIEPATFRLVAQCLNQLRHRVLVVFELNVQLYICLYVCYLIISHLLSETSCSFRYVGIANDPLYDGGKSKRFASVNRLQSLVVWYSLVSKANKVSSNLAELQEHDWDWGGNKSDDRQNVGFIDTKYFAGIEVLFRDKAICL
jgi:hypothetical protein